MRNIVVLIVLLAFSSCIRKTNQEDRKGLKDDIYMMIKEYMDTHAEYNSFTLVTNIYPNEKTAEHDSLYGSHDSRFASYYYQYYMIGPSYKGMFSTGEWSYGDRVPTTYIKVRKRLVFIQSPCDNLYQDKKDDSFYNRNAVSLPDSVINNIPYKRIPTIEFVEKAMVFWINPVTGHAEKFEGNQEERGFLLSGKRERTWENAKSE